MDATPAIGGATVPLKGKLFDLLNGVYSKSDSECDIDISFNRRADGKQINQVRDLVVSYLQTPNLSRGRKIAERLEQVTTHRSGLGLLFLIVGIEGLNQKIVISRFPADSAILAEEKKQTLNIEFLERVFMKSAKAYKAVLYQHSSFSTGFWMGRAIDKQINTRVAPISNYWIADFLDSDFLLTAAAGTRRLAIALRGAAKKSSDIAVKSEIAAAVTLASSLAGQNSSIRDFINRFALSKTAMSAIEKEVKIPSLIDEKFQFDINEFSNQIAYRSIELDSGAILTAESADFNDVFDRETIDSAGAKERFSTEGKVVGEKLGKAR